MGFDPKSQSATIYDSGTQPFSCTTLSTVGLAVASILSKPAETANKSIYIQSFNPTQNEILAALEEITDMKWKVDTISTGDALVRVSGITRRTPKRNPHHNNL
jgi:hypothetical protein